MAHDDLTTRAAIPIPVSPGTLRYEALAAAFVARGTACIGLSRTTQVVDAT